MDQESGAGHVRKYSLNDWAEEMEQVSLNGKCQCLIFLKKKQ